MCNCSQMMLFLTILFLIQIFNAKEHSPECPENQWVNLVNQKKSCCDLCHPGSYMIRACNSVNRTLCKICPHNTFTDLENDFKSCLSCSVCNDLDGLKEKQPCKRMSDTICTCKINFYLYQITQTCKPCKKCGSGQEMVKDCGDITDRVCENCKLGKTYELNGTCVPCQACGVSFMKVHDCTLTEDTKCVKVNPQTPSEKKSSMQKPIIIGISCAFIFFVIMVFVFCVCKKRFQPCSLNNCIRRINRSHSDHNLRHIRSDETAIEMEEIANLIQGTNSIPMSELTYGVREQIAQLLDTDDRKNNWKNLACKMGKNDNFIQNLAKETSPTMTLIRYYESEKLNPTVQGFLSLLYEMRRFDAVKVLRDFVASHENTICV